AVGRAGGQEHRCCFVVVNVSSLLSSDTHPERVQQPLCVLSPLSVTENVSVSGSYGGGGDDEEQALLDRMAKREERRQRRMKEALERQQQPDPAAPEASDGAAPEKYNAEEERPSSWRKGRYRDSVEEEEKSYSSRREKEQDWPRGDAKAAPEGEEEEEVDRNMLLSNDTEEDFEVSEILRGSVRSAEAAVAAASEEQDEDARLEAERKLEELKRRRDDAESEEFERMRQKQQEAEAELEELKRKREERRKVLEEEERQRKQEEEERRAREEEEKRKMKEEIERRRAEAAEKRQKVDDTMDGEGKPFKCVSPRGSSLKVLFCMFHVYSSVKASHSPVVSKIDNRLEQYTSARENKESRSPRSGAVDLPMVTDSIRNIKSMWEKGSVFNAPGGGGSAFKEAAVIKTGVAGRINDWLNKTPDGGKTPGGKPTDLKPVDVTNKRSLWENKGGASTKVKIQISSLAPVLTFFGPLLIP
uniref:Caldesmon 1 n=1 Tax=Oryzias melastigma TaxID=30732 RepID=A0A3B3C5F1_ORYME